MSDAPEGNGKDDQQFLSDMEKVLRQIINNRKASKADKLAAVAHGLKLTAIRHKIMGGDGSKGFFE